MRLAPVCLGLLATVARAQTCAPADAAAKALDRGDVAAAESLLEVTAASHADLTRIAWHLGNRHVPVELMGDRLRILEDHVLAEMVRGLGHTLPVGLEFEGVDRPEAPERGGSRKGDDAEPVHHHAPQHEESPRELVPEGGEEDGAAQRA